MGITAEKIKKLMKIPGKVRGEVFRTDTRFILAKEGKTGLEKVKKEAEKLGISIPYETAKPLDWYAIGLKEILTMNF